MVITKDWVLENLIKMRKLEDEKSLVRHTKIINTADPILCVSVPNMRKLARIISKNDYKDYLQTALNTKNSYFEETFVQALVVAEIADQNNLIPLLEKLIKKIDNWAICDSMITSIKILKTNKKHDFFNFFLERCFQENEFEARLGIVTLMTYFLEERYLEQILNMCKTVKNDAFYVKMALAWLISYAFVKFREQTLQLFSQKVLTKFVQNKAISKCRDSYRVTPKDKELLLSFRIK